MIATFATACVWSLFIGCFVLATMDDVKLFCSLKEKFAYWMFVTAITALSVFIVVIQFLHHQGK
jgi:hypothetical protein